MNRPPMPPNSARTAAVELARTLRDLASRPAAQSVLRGLEAAMPEAAAQVRAALEDPAGTLGEMLAPMASAAADELAETDRVIAAGLARAFGSGVARGVGRGKR
jgi:hypothetical protein